jgi:two-component system response regulator YesN
MYRFLLVADEEIIRRGFETKIDWPVSGFEFLPPYENGRDAIATINDLRPDIVMTDVQMPHDSGFSLAAHIMEHYPEMVIVILSGYNEDSYAQIDINNKIFDYVFKPISSSALTILLAKIKSKLDADHRLREKSTLRLKADFSGDILRK